MNTTELSANQLLEPSQGADAHCPTVAEAAAFILASESYANAIEREWMLRISMRKQFPHAVVYTNLLSQVVRFGSAKTVKKFVMYKNSEYGRNFWDNAIYYMCDAIFKNEDEMECRKWRTIFGKKNDSEILDLFSRNISLHPEHEAETYFALTLIFPKFVPKYVKAAFSALLKREEFPACVEPWIRRVSLFLGLTLHNDDAQLLLQRFMIRQNEKFMLSPSPNGVDSTRSERVEAACHFMRTTFAAARNIIGHIIVPWDIDINPMEQISFQLFDIKEFSDAFYRYYFSIFSLLMFDIKDGNRIMFWNAFIDNNFGSFYQYTQGMESLPFSSKTYNPKNPYNVELEAMTKFYEYIKFDDRFTHLIQNFGYERFVQYFAISLIHSERYASLEKVFFQNKGRMTTKHGVLCVFMNTMMSRAKRCDIKGVFELWVRVVRMCIEWGYTDTYRDSEAGDEPPQFVDQKYCADIATRILLNALFETARRLKSEGWRKYCLLILHIADQGRMTRASKNIISTMLTDMTAEDIRVVFVGRWHDAVRTKSAITNCVAGFTKCPDVFATPEIRLICQQKLRANIRPPVSVATALYKKYLEKHPLFDCFQDVVIEQESFVIKEIKPTAVKKPSLEKPVPENKEKTPTHHDENNNKGRNEASNPISNVGKRREPYDGKLEQVVIKEEVEEDEPIAKQPRLIGPTGQIDGKEGMGSCSTSKVIKLEKEVKVEEY